MDEVIIIRDCCVKKMVSTSRDAQQTQECRCGSIWRKKKIESDNKLHDCWVKMKKTDCDVLRFQCEEWYKQLLNALMKGAGYNCWVKVDGR